MLRREAFAVVTNRHAAAATGLLDPHFSMSRARVPPRVGEALLDDPEDLDLLVRAELDVRRNLEIDFQGSVCGQKVDVPAERRVEGRIAARRGESEDGEACLLLSGLGGLLEPRGNLLRGRAPLEQARLGGDGEEVLSETVMDVSGDPSPLLCDDPPELGRAD